MTPLPPVLNVLRTIEEWSVGADLSAMTGRYWRYEGGPPSATALASMAEQMNTHAQSNLAHLHVASTHLSAVRIQDLGSATGASAEHVGYGAGILTGSPLPGSACVLEVYHIARRYRGGKARNYFPFGSTTTIATQQTWEGAWLGTTSSSILAYMQSFGSLEASGTHIREQVSVSYFKKGKWVEDPVTGRPRYIPERKEPPGIDPIISWSTSTRIASQRRRLSSGG